MNRVFYHRMDLDGRAAGAIARRGLEAAGEPFRLYPYDYADPFPEADVRERDTVWFIDVAWQPFENMARLARERGCRVVSIDHHRSVAESGVLAAIESHFSADNSRAGCLLAWEYFMPEEPAPEWVDLLSRYDIWDNSDGDAWAKRILPFQMGMQARPTDPVDNWPFWKRLFERGAGASRRFVRGTIRDGRAILAWVLERSAADARDHAFEAHLGRLKALCINSTAFSSSALDAAWNPQRHHLMLIYARRRDATWRVALFTSRPDVDVSRIAERFGGGGHRSAAGFSAAAVEVRGGRLAIEPARSGPGERRR